MKSKDMALLKMGTIIEDMQEASGLTVAEMRSAEQAKVLAAFDRLSSLPINYPCPRKTSDILLTETSETQKVYKCCRRLAGKGMGKAAVIGFHVLTSVAIESDDRLWFHASISRFDLKMPTYDDLYWLRENFFQGTWAMQYFPPEEQHISHHGTCLHLWTCLEDLQMPDFRKLGTI